MRMEVRGIFGEDEISGEDETFDCSNMNPLNQAVHVISGLCKREE